MRKTVFTVGGRYHCFNSSIEGRHSFADSKDYHRFLELLYLANDDIALRHDGIGTTKFEEVIRLPRGKRLVGLQAFCVMPDHYHLLVEEVIPGGITSFMRKVGTAYTAYFNSRYNRKGNLFLKPFKSLQIDTEQSIRQLVSYIHCNPATLLDGSWKTGPVADPHFLGKHMEQYPYSSFNASSNAASPLRSLIDVAGLDIGHIDSIAKMFQDARTYCGHNIIP